MVSRLLFVCLTFFLIPPAVAQDDPWVVQRCVWSCLANSPGVESAEYDQCVQEACAPLISPQPEPVVQSDWISGVATDGVHRFAQTYAEQGYTFTYFCTASDSYFTLNIDTLPPGQHRLLIGKTEFVVPFDMSRGVLSVLIPPQSQFMDGVRRGGNMLTLSDFQGNYLIRFSLQGADQHIGQAVAGCAA